MSVNCYITFTTTYYAIRSESLLKKADLTFKMVPVPRVISSSCGTALRCSCENLDKIRQHLLEYNIVMENFYKLEEAGLQISLVEEMNFPEK